MYVLGGPPSQPSSQQKEHPTPSDAPFLSFPPPFSFFHFQKNFNPSILQSFNSSILQFFLNTYTFAE